MLSCGSSQTSPTTPAAETVAVLVGGGDIADCSPGAAATATLLDGISGTVFTAGDNAYPAGATADFANCYGPTWGRHRSRTRPAPGNHDYLAAGAAPYYAYFGDNAGASGLGYYSFDLGAWHIISLNSNVTAATGSAQYQWLTADLLAHPAVCTAAIWHHPMFSSFLHGNDLVMQDVWRLLYDKGADVVLNGHDHAYERFAPQDGIGRADAARGIREFLVGMGGAPLYAQGTVRANSEVRNNTTFGVIKLTLRCATYDWEFVPAAGGSFRDSGSGACVR